MRVKYPYRLKLVNISDGNTNLDIIVLNSAERTLSVDVYAVD